MQDFHRLLVWKKSHALVLEVHRACGRHMRRRHPSLVAQLVRSAESIPASIVEGCGRESRREFARFIQVAIGSAVELEYHLLLSRDLGMLALTQHARLEARTVEVKRMLVGLAVRLRDRSAPEPEAAVVSRRSRKPVTDD